MVLASFSAQFGIVDWLVVVAYLVFTSWLGARMAGKQATIRDFFLGGRTLPWYAVSGSIIATEISALTFVSVPWVVAQPGGNLTYLQLGVFGSFLARILVGYVLVPAYYRREIYSPYDYMHHQLGGRVRVMTTALFTLGGVLGQSARVYLTAEVVNVVLHDQLVWLTQRLGLNELAWAILLISGVSVAWTLVGGMTTVVWTDVVLFLAFLGGAVIALGTVIASLDGGLAELLRAGWAARDSGLPQLGTALKHSGPWGKFTFFDWSTDPTRTYTMWTAAIASTWGGLGAYGTDQLMAQRMFCCRGPREARWAIISSQLSIAVTILVALAGAGLFAYYQKHDMGGEALALFRGNGDRIFPIFVVEVIPAGLKGLIIAAIFAAAISSVMGILTALAQTSLAAFYNPLREAHLRRSARRPTESDSSREDRRTVMVSRLMVIFWGVALSLLAYGAQAAAAKYKSLLDLGLALSGYTGGGLLAGFALSYLPLRIDGRGYMWSAPLSVLTIFAICWHRDFNLPWYQDWTLVTCLIVAAGILATWLAVNVPRGGSSPDHLRRVLPFPLQTLILLAGLAGVLWLNLYGHWGRKEQDDKFGRPVFTVLAFPWYVPIGSLVAFVWGYLLARRQTRIRSGLDAGS